MPPGLRWSPQDSFADKAVTVIRETTGLDVSGHRPRDPADLDPTVFDRIIVLNRNVAAEIHLPGGPVSLAWDISDPYGRSSMTSIMVAKRDRLTACPSVSLPTYS